MKLNENKKGGILRFIGLAVVVIVIAVLIFRYI